MGLGEIAVNRSIVGLASIITLVATFTADAGVGLRAQQTESGFVLGVVAANCEREPTAFPFQGGDCVPAEGAVVVVTTTSGELVGTCIAETMEPEAVVAGCSVTVPFGEAVIVTEDVSTITPGYAPTINPQRFDVPATLPDGVFGGPVFLNLPTGDAQNQTPVDSISRVSEVTLTDDPSWWVVPFAPGYGNTEEGDLYFGALVENPTTTTVHVGVSFRAYETDGTPFPGCQMPGGDGPGVTTTIAPGETALLTCARTIVPRTLDGLQVTARLWNIEPLWSPPLTLEVTEAEFVPLPEQSSPMETAYEASALVRATGNGDIDALLLFRFYDERGVQLGTCESDLASGEAEVAQRVMCSIPLYLDTTRPQPTSVRVEAPPVRQ